MSKTTPATCKCQRCRQDGEMLHMVQDMSDSWLHPLCAVAIHGEDWLCNLPYDAVANIRRSDVGDRIMRKLLDAQSEAA